MTVTNIQPRVARKQLDEVDRIADCMEVLIAHEEDEDVRARKEDKLADVRAQIESKRERMDKEGSGE